MSSVFFNNRGLIWKEVRQLIPLVAMLFAVGVVLLLVWQMSPDQMGEFSQFGRYIPLALPGLFAVGAAAIAVGQEREQKTILWLASMPVSPQRLIRTKFLVCLAALCVMWIGCWLLMKFELMMGLFPQGFRFPFSPNLNQETYTTKFSAILYWHLHSLYVLVCGFYTSWRIKNSFASLIAIIPLAFAPFAIVQFGDFTRRMLGGGPYVDVRTLNIVTPAVTLAATAIVGLLAWRAAMRVLLPTAARKRSKDETGILPYAVFFLSGDAPRSVPDQPFRSTTLAMFRQSFGNNRLVLAGILLMILAGLFGLMAGHLSHQWIQRGGSFLLIWIGCFGVCCLGVFAFTGDGKAERLRFFADRGVSPAKLWLGRHLLAVAVIGIAALFYIVVGVISESIVNETYYSRAPPLFAVILSAVYCYNISQWVGQTFRALPISLVLAPVAIAVSLSAAAAVLPWSDDILMYMLYILYWSPVLLALVVVWCMLPLLATLLSMRKFADGVRGRALILSSAPALVLFIVIPLIPITVEHFSFPSIKTAQRHSLVQQALQANAMRGLPEGSVSFHTHNGRSAFPGESDQHDPVDPATTPQYDERDFTASQLVNIYVDDSYDNGVRADPETVKGIVSLASFAQVRFEQSPGGKEHLLELNEWVDTMTKMAIRLRRSRRLIDQDHADATESWIAELLVHDSYQPHLDSPIAQAAMKQVADKKGRLAGRRRAVLISWYDWNEQRKSGDPASRFGGYLINGWSGLNRSKLGQWLFRDRMIDSIAFNLLEYLNAEERGRSSLQQRKTIHRLITGTDLNFRLGAYGDRTRRDGASQAVVLNTDIRAFSPAAQWYAAWEKGYAGQ